MTATTAPVAGADEIPTPEAGIEPDGLDTPAIVMWSFVSVVAVVSVMLGATALFYEVQNSFDAERIVAPAYVDSETVISQQQGLLNGWDKPRAAGQGYRIPIDRAKELVVRELQNPAG